MVRVSSAVRHLEIALAIRVGIPHLERVVHGIRHYAESRIHWRFLVSPETHDLPPTSLEGWRGDGVIALFNTRADVRVLRTLPCPVVNISGAMHDSAFPRVRNDYRAIGRTGAGHLRKRGFRRFGFYGVRDLWYSEEIEAGFSGYLRDLGLPLGTLHSVNTLETVPRWNEGQGELERWLRTFKPPFAVMAAHDPRAAMIIRACERMGLRVPQDVAVIGSNNDTVTCETCRPQLTSIDRNGYDVGREAAALLDRLMRGERPPAEEIIIPPGNVRERESTNTLAVDRPELLAAIRFVETRHADPVGVEQIAGACGRSRRWLEETFRRELNCSPSDFLRRVRVESAAQRLIGGSAAVTLESVARQSGFSGARQMNMAFLQLKGARPKQFLKDGKPPGAAPE